MPTAPRPFVRYTIVSGISRFIVRVFATGLLSVLGHKPIIEARNFEGEILLGEDSLESSTLHLSIRADSLVVTSEVNDKDRKEMERRMWAEVLEVSRFPYIVYACSAATGNLTDLGRQSLALEGQLTLHGIARVQPVTAQLNFVGDMLRASGECTLRQTDYGIVPASALAGALRVKDELSLSFDLAARKQKQD